MADTSIFLLFFLTALYTATAQQTYTNITKGFSLTPTGNSSWPSPSGLYAFGFYKEGSGYSVGIFISGIPEKSVVWTAYRNDPPVNQTATLVLNADGRLVLRPTQGQEERNLATDSQSTSSASMLDTGNFVLYNSDRDIIWQSFDYPTDTLLVGQPLLNGYGLVSSVSLTDHSWGISYLIMQNDGNLVQYPLDGPWTPQNAYYSSGTWGAGSNVTLNLDDDGRLYLFNLSIVMKNISDVGYTKERRIYLVRNDVDGIFRVYSYDLDQKTNWSRLWSSSDDKCVVKGLCGLNGYCVLDDTKANCVCIPGFDFVDPSRRNAGCVRNSTVRSCKNNDGSIEDNMRELANTVWEDDYYHKLTRTSKEDCKSACVKDCNCAAALFKNEQCTMQRLPLRYGRRSLQYSNIALVKVESEPIMDRHPPDHLPKRRHKKLELPIVIIIVSFAAFAFIVFAISGTLIYRKRVWAYKMTIEKGNFELCEDFGLRVFSYAELGAVTNGFRDEVGSGSFGTVYKGIIQNNGKLVAVKRLEKGLIDGEREFHTELKVIGKTHHRNLVKLLGYCLEGPNRLLVYEYMSSGSLANVLYLHEECEMQIIHCDIKPQNILMDESMCAKVSDFGLAKLMKPDQSKSFASIRGTKGYVAPEWHRNLPVTVKADVYSFGIVLLEIISRRRSVDMTVPEEEAILEEWVYQCFEEGELGKLVGDEVVDKRILDRMVKIGLWCIQDEPLIRPSMKKVLLMLEGTVDIPIPPSLTSFQSAI